MTTIERGDTVRTDAMRTDAARVDAVRASGRVQRRVVAGGVVLVLALAGCAEPVAPDPVPGDDEGGPLESEQLDPAADELSAALAVLRDGVQAARDELTTAASADGLPEASAAADRALALLLDDPSRTTDAASEAVRPLFPAVTADRTAAEQQDDALSSTVSLARDAGGDIGRATVETLRDPIAGDLGAWELDAEGAVARAREATAVSGSLSGQLDTVSEQVAALDGDGVRALAWTFAATEASDLEDVQLAAERAGAHLGVVLVALDLLLAPPADDAATGEDDADGDAETEDEDASAPTDHAAGRVDA